MISVFINILEISYELNKSAQRSKELELGSSENVEDYTF